MLTIGFGACDRIALLVTGFKLEGLLQLIFDSLEKRKRFHTLDFRVKKHVLV